MKKNRIFEFSPSLKVPEYELLFSFARSSGKGGQNVNKVNSKAVLTWSISSSAFLTPDVKSRFLAKFKNQISSEGLLVLASDRYRDQPMNIKDVIDKLGEMLLSVEHPPKKRKKTKPTWGSKVRRLESKKIHSEKKSLRGRIKT